MVVPIICLLFIAIGGAIILRATQKHDLDLEINDDTYALSDCQIETKGDK